MARKFCEAIKKNGVCYLSVRTYNITYRIKKVKF